MDLVSPETFQLLQQSPRLLSQPTHSYFLQDDVFSLSFSSIFYSSRLHFRFHSIRLLAHFFSSHLNLLLLLLLPPFATTSISSFPFSYRFSLSLFFSHIYSVLRCAAAQHCCGDGMLGISHLMGHTENSTSLTHSRRRRTRHKVYHDD